MTTEPSGRWTKIHWGLLLVALAVLTVAGRGQHFFYDEWAFVGGKLDEVPLLDSYLVPHNEHWSLLPLLAYRTLGATVGLRSYWPYLGLLLLLHLCVTHVLWRLMLLTGSTPLVATALAGVFGVLGAAAEDLVWAFQIGFVGAALLGLGAIQVAVTGRVSWRKSAILVALLTASLATSGVGLAYLVVVPTIYAWRRWRQALVVVGLPLVVYATWFTAYGRSPTHTPPVSTTLPLMVGMFVVVGLASALTKYLGVMNTPASFLNEMTSPIALLLVGAPVLAKVTLGCRVWWDERTLAARVTLSMYVGAVAFFASAGLARAGLGLAIATSSRYVYIAMALLLPGLALLISRGTERHQMMKRAVVPIAVAISLSNIFQLMTFADAARAENDASRRVIVAASNLARSSSPSFAEQLPEPNLAPDLTTADLISRHLDAAFAGVHPTASDRLTASLNLQIRVAPDRGAGTLSTCDTRARLITLPVTPAAARTFLLSGDSTISITMREVDESSAQRTLNLARGRYQLSSKGASADLTIKSETPGSMLAGC